jgi:pyruvate/2-oxoglutarate/acetoin dehydrogenase E1 component
MYCDFLGRAGDEVFNQLSKWQAMSGGILRMPVVLRISLVQSMVRNIHKTGLQWLLIFQVLKVAFGHSI